MPFKVAAQAGQNVYLIDTQQEQLEKAQKSIQNNLTRVAKKAFKDDAAKAESFVKESSARYNIMIQIQNSFT